jgi:hypothetical protein
MAAFTSLILPEGRTVKFVLREPPTMMDKAAMAMCKGAQFHPRQKPEAYNAPDFGEWLGLLSPPVIDL